jgi:hypothetical protein
MKYPLAESVLVLFVELNFEEDSLGLDYLLTQTSFTNIYKYKDLNI